MARSDTKSKSRFTDGIIDAAAVLDAQGQLVEFNTAFFNSVLEGQAVDGNYTIENLGASVALGHAEARAGRFKELHVFLDVKGQLRDWRAAFVPQPDNTVLVVLTGTSSDSAFYDILTSLPNRRIASQRLESEWLRWLRSPRNNFTLAVADIDRFKNVNDNYGHAIGDQVIQHVSTLLNANLRGGDWVARWGGEEFLLFFHDVNEAAAMQAAERIRQAFEKQPFTNTSGLQINVTISIGLAGSENYDPQSPPADIQTLVNEADILLYDAKREGRNRTVCRNAHDRVLWSAAEINTMLSTETLQPRSYSLTTANQQQVGSMWLPTIAATDRRTVRHMYHAAIQESLIDKVEAAWLDTVRTTWELASHGELACVVVNPNTIQRFSDLPQLHVAIRRFTQAGIRLVLVTRFDFPFTEVPVATQQTLAQLDVQICLWTGVDKIIAQDLLSDIQPTYVLVDSPTEQYKQRFAELLAMLLERNLKLILFATQQPKNVDPDRLVFLAADADLNP